MSRTTSARVAAISRDGHAAVAGTRWAAESGMGGMIIPTVPAMLEHRPSEYWVRRHEIGLGSLMWGADYPHIEGTWPRSRRALARCFDVARLAPIAARVGPTLDELVAAR